MSRSSLFTRLTAGVFILAVFIAWGVAAWGLVKDTTSTVPSPSPRVEWQSFPIGGLLLCKPEPDSSATSRCLLLPPGSVLLVPKLVDGREPKPRSSI